MKNKIPVAVLGSGAIILAMWIILGIPQFVNTADVFEVSAENIGMIQLADEVGGPLSEPIKMIFVWSGNVIEDNDNQLLMNTSYEYKDILTDEVLWETVFDETVEKTTRKYVDKPGYFMFPVDLQQQDYQVYDVGGAVMNYEFIGVTEIEGLEVYEFSGKTTFDISDVYPNFKVQIFEDYSATNFIEPETGIEVSFTEQFTDYAVIDGEKIPVLVAWDEPSEFSQKILVQKAQSFKSLHEIYHNVVPAMIIIITASVTIIVSLQSKFKKSKKDFSKLEQTDKQKDEFVSMMGHEIRNPLTPIISMCDILLMEKDGKLNEEQRKRIEIIQKSSTQINELLADFTEVKKIDLDQISLSKSDIDLKEYLENVIESVRPFTGQKNIELHLDLNDTWKITCDQKRISQVISNLIKNSIDFVPENMGKITISAKLNDEGTIISVEDNGVGIAAAASELIFDKFKQVHNTSEIKHEGTGLGLSICKGIVEAHGGEIWLDKNYEDGTRLQFLIPK